MQLSQDLLSLLSQLYFSLVLLLLTVIAYFLRESYVTMKSQGKQLNEVIQRLVKVETDNGAKQRHMAKQLDDHEQRIRDLEKSER